MLVKQPVDWVLYYETSTSHKNDEINIDEFYNEVLDIALEKGLPKTKINAHEVYGEIYAWNRMNKEGVRLYEIGIRRVNGLFSVHHPIKNENITFDSPWVANDIATGAQIGVAKTKEELLNSFSLKKLACLKNICYSYLMYKRRAVVALCNKKKCVEKVERYHPSMRYSYENYCDGYTCKIYTNVVDNNVNNYFPVHIFKEQNSQLWKLYNCIKQRVYAGADTALGALEFAEYYTHFLLFDSDDPWKEGVINHVFPELVIPDKNDRSLLLKYLDVIYSIEE